MRLHMATMSLLAGLLPACLLLALAGAPGTARAQMKLKDYAVGRYPIGGEFTLTNQDGGRTRLADFRGKAVLMSFGYTHCPDVCPTTLSEFKQIRQALGQDGAQLQALFISVDPKRDTPALLKQYIGYFDPTFVGLTGSEEELEEVSEKYMARFRTRESSSAVGYFVDHTTFMYLIDTQGKVRYLFTPDASRQIVIEGVKTVLAGMS